MRGKKVDVVAETIGPAVDFVKSLQIYDKVVIAHGHDNDTICSAVVMQRLLKDFKNIDATLFPLRDNFAIRDSDVDEMSDLNPTHIIVVDIARVEGRGAESYLSSKMTLFVDHHQPVKMDSIVYCNPRICDKKIYMPVSYIVYKMYESFGDPAKIAWIAGVGTLSDHGVTIAKDLFEFIRKIDPKLIGDTNLKDEDLFSYSLIGSIAQIFDSARIVAGKEGAAHVARTLEHVKSYNSVVKGGGEDTAKLLKWSSAVKKEFKRLVADFNKKKKLLKSNIVFYEIPSEMHIKSSLSGYLAQFYPDKVLVIAQKFDGNFDVSFRRGERNKTDLNKLAKKSIKGIPNSEGGGHEAASGARIPINHLPKFIRQL